MPLGKPEQRSESDLLDPGLSDTLGSLHAEAHVLLHSVTVHQPVHIRIICFLIDADRVKSQAAEPLVILSLKRLHLKLDE